MKTRARKAISVLLCAALIVSASGTAAFADVKEVSYNDGICEHHKVHTDTCGYREARPEVPCKHEHTDACYKYVGVESPGDATESGGNADRDRVLDCPHEKGNHDDSCGYQPAVEAHPCEFNCTECNNISFVNEDGESERHKATPVTDSSVTLWDTSENDGWYYVTGTVNFNGNEQNSKRIAVKGNVSLILCDNGVLNANQGIAVPAGSSLTIYGQSSGSGKLNASSSSYNAPIGGTPRDVNTETAGTAGTGNITIVGGTVNATVKIKGGGPAAIGSAYANNDPFKIEIKGGNVTANAGEGVGAGIGGKNADITISGGTVNATGGYIPGDYQMSGGAGIGNSGDAGDACNITISGGTVTAKGGREAAGIGGGKAGFGGTVQISNATLKATGERTAIDAADFGDDWGADGGYLVIDNNAATQHEAVVAIDANGLSGMSEDGLAQYKSLTVRPATVKKVGVVPKQSYANVGNEIQYGIVIEEGAPAGTDVSRFVGASWSVFSTEGRAMSPNTRIDQNTGLLTIGGDEKLMDLTVSTSLSIPAGGVQPGNTTASVSVSQRGYTVSFDANGGTVSASPMTTRYGVLTGTLPVPERRGHTFMGWYTEKTQAADSKTDTLAGLEPVDGNTVFSQDTTVYAGWKKKVYRVTFDGTGGMNNYTVQVDFGGHVPGLSIPAEVYGQFDGWYADPDYTHRWDFDREIVEGEMTLYAKWKKADPGSGSGGGSGSTGSSSGSSSSGSSSSSASSSGGGSGSGSSDSGTGSQNTAANNVAAGPGSENVYVPTVVPGTGSQLMTVVNTVADGNPMEGLTNVSVVSGAWSQNEQGDWSLQYSDGAVASNTWVCVTEADGAHWYHFNDTGLMDSGWLNLDGKVYFLHNVHDGTAGRMLTGWQLIGEKWYYFSKEEDATLGLLLTDTTTPDGYKVNANGEWIQ